MRLEPEPVAPRQAGTPPPRVGTTNGSVPSGQGENVASPPKRSNAKRYVIIRDDDTNALTPVECLERLYRPFLDRGLPVNLAVIPEVSTRAAMQDGSLEGFLAFAGEDPRSEVPIGSNPELLAYLKANPGFKVLQHGYRHDYLEFDRADHRAATARLDLGMDRLLEAGFEKPDTFVAPYDKLSRATLKAAARRFRVLSTGWFELRRLPVSWWAAYLRKKYYSTPHWRVGQTYLLSHPGCLLSCHRNRSAALAGIMANVNLAPLTVLVTHWWEYFRHGKPDDSFIDFLHGIAEFLAADDELEVISFSNLAALGAKVGGISGVSA